MYKLILMLLETMFQGMENIDANYLLKTSPKKNTCNNIYWIYELSFEPNTVEDGECTVNITCTGFSRNEDPVPLIEQSDKILNAFNGIKGVFQETAFLFTSNGGQAIPSGEEKLDKFVVYLKLKVWKGSV